MHHDLVMDAVHPQGELKKMVTASKDAILIAIDAAPLVQHSLEIQNANPPAIYHLGQALLSTLLLQALPDNQEESHLALQWKLDGPFGNLYSECQRLGGVRGTLFNPSPEVQQLRVPMGKGLLQVRRGKKIVSTGIVESKGNVVMDILEYLEKSDQRNASIAIWIDVQMNQDTKASCPYKIQHARGYLVDILPQANLSQTHSLLYQWNQHLESLGPLSSWMLGKDPTLSILQFISGEYKPHITESTQVEFYCTCNKDRAERALKLSDREIQKDPEAHMETPGPLNVSCEFCGKSYLF
jgi:molecular chaperone Hsp33